MASTVVAGVKCIARPKNDSTLAIFAEAHTILLLEPDQCKQRMSQLLSLRRLGAFAPLAETLHLSKSSASAKMAKVEEYDIGGEFKKWGKIPQKSLFSLLGGEYQPPLMLETNRTSLRKSNSPPTSIWG